MKRLLPFLLILLAPAGASAQCPGGVCPPALRPPRVEERRQPFAPAPRAAEPVVHPQIAAASVRSAAQEGRRQRGGSGTVVAVSGARALVVTNRHVVEGTSAVTVHWRDGRTAPAAVLATDPTADLAALAVEQPRGIVECVPVAAEPAAPDTAVVQVGYPGGRYTARSGRLLGWNGAWVGGAKVLDVKINVAPGDSGSGVFDPARLALVGVVWGKPASGPGPCSAVGLLDTRRFLETEPVCRWIDIRIGRRRGPAPPPGGVPTPPGAAPAAPPAGPAVPPAPPASPPAVDLAPLHARLDALHKLLTPLEGVPGKVGELARDIDGLRGGYDQARQAAEGVESRLGPAVKALAGKVEGLTGAAPAAGGLLGWLPAIAGLAGLGGAYPLALGALALARKLRAGKAGPAGSVNPIPAAPPQPATPPAMPPAAPAVQAPAPPAPPNVPAPAPAETKYVGVEKPNGELAALLQAMDSLANVPGMLDPIMRLKSAAKQIHAGTVPAAK